MVAVDERTYEADTYTSCFHFTLHERFVFKTFPVLPCTDILDFDDRAPFHIVFSLVFANVENATDRSVRDVAAGEPRKCCVQRSLVQPSAGIASGKAGFFTLRFVLLKSAFVFSLLWRLRAGLLFRASRMLYVY